jgi:RNA polymerase sigma-70 factor (ECF subfamily)
MASSQEVTRLLTAWSHGEQAALDQLMPLVYAELRRMAGRFMRAQSPSHTLQTTALIHEAYLRLAVDASRQWENRTHFFRVAAKAMRQILVDHARARQALRRGGHEHRAIALDKAVVIPDNRVAEMVALDDALTELAKLSPRQSQIVELRYFGGFDVGETAEALSISPETVMRDWRAAKAWLYSQLSPQQSTAGLPYDT